jgi:hypothetical protein
VSLPIGLEPGRGQDRRPREQQGDLAPLPGRPTRNQSAWQPRTSGRGESEIMRPGVVQQRDLAPAFTLERRGGWPAFAARAPGADRGGARPVRRVAGTARAPTPPWPGGPKSGKRRPGAQRFPWKARPVTGGSCGASGSASSSRGAYPGAVANRGRRAPRALEDVGESSHRSEDGSQEDGSQEDGSQEDGRRRKT